MNVPKMGKFGMKGTSIVPGCNPDLSSDLENPVVVEITVQGFNHPAEVLAALMEFGGQLAQSLTEGDLASTFNELAERGPGSNATYSKNTVTGETATEFGVGGPAGLCDEHAEQLAQQLGAAQIASDAEKFLRDLNGGMGSF